MDKKISMAVYCGHVLGNDVRYKEDAKKLGSLMAKNGIRLIFGGGDVGLMGTIAAAVIEDGGDVIGVSTPQVIALQEPAVEHVHIEITKNISDRRQRMFELSDAFCILPGGMGTLDELSDIMVRQQIGETEKPIFFLNTKNYWAPFGQLFMHMHAAGFITDPKVYHMTIHNNPEDIINAYLNHNETASS